MTSQPKTDFRIQHLREKLGDRYEFQALLGRGAFAAVYLVRNLRLDRLEALKVLSDAYDQDEKFVRRFIQEAKLVASLDHPNIVKVYDYGEVDGIVWFSMQYVDGPTLRTELEAQGRLSPIAVARLAIPMLDALGYSHELGTVHRDVKPSNILLDGRGHPFLMDFGIAKSSANALKTMTGRILGTPAYISPEQIQLGEVDGRADLYALGAAMYEMLAGRTPFQGEDTLRTIVQRLNEDPEPLHTYCLSIDEELEGLIMRSLERDPDDRFSDAASMREALVDWVSEQSSQQDLVMMASAPKPVALERLPTTVQDLPASTVAAEGPTVKMDSLDQQIEALEPGQGQSSVWATALGVLLSLTVCGLVAARWSLDLGTTSVAASLPAALEIERPVVFDDGSRIAEPASIEHNSSASTEALPAQGPSAQGPFVAEVAADDVIAEGTIAGERTPASEPAMKPVAPSPPPPPVVSNPPPPPIRRPVTAPRLVSTAEPVLPADNADCAGQQVILSLKVAEDGSVARSRSLRSSHEDCAKAAIQAASKYRFEPALDEAGQPIAASTTVSIRFPGD